MTKKVDKSENDIEQLFINHQLFKPISLCFAVLFWEKARKLALLYYSQQKERKEREGGGEAYIYFSLFLPLSAVISLDFFIHNSYRLIYLKVIHHETSS